MCPYEHTLYIKREGASDLMGCLYVDDLIYTGSNMSMIKNFKKSMMVEFDTSDLRHGALFPWFRSESIR